MNRIIPVLTTLWLVAGCGHDDHDDHAGHDHAAHAPAGEKKDDHAGHDHAAKASSGEKKDDHAGHDHAKGGHGAHASEADGAAGDWCAEHALPESKCTQCNPALVERFKAAGDWCAEHAFPESVCPKCNPQQPPAQAKVDWCVEHGLPESKCTKCNPGLVDQFKSAGDWCGEHQFPESVCPQCNPQPVPATSPVLGVVTLSKEALARSNFQIRPAGSGVIAVSVELPAEVQFNPDRVAHVSSLVTGQLTNVAVTLGSKVKAGQPLASLRSVELGQARAELARTNALRSTARKHRNRQKRLRAEGITSERSRLEAELALQQASAERDAASSRLRVFGVRGGSGSDLELTSPIDGVVVERHATRGENVSPDDTLFVVADLSRVWVIGRVYEQQVAQVREGMTATLTLNAYPRQTWRGTVDFVGARLDEKTRTLPVRIELDNPDRALRPGLFGSLKLASSTAERPHPLVPLGAVQTVNGQAVVFVPGASADSFSARRVQLGNEGPENVEIVDGVRAGERVVTEGAFLLKSELMRHALGQGCAH